MNKPNSPAISIHPDAAIIEALGGSTALARALGPEYTTQRVQNWKYRGVPALVQLRRPDLFPHQGDTTQEAA